MRVLWFSVTPSLYGRNNTAHNGGGWISSLERLIKNHTDIELGIAFEFEDDAFKIENEGVFYYPINAYKSISDRFLRKVRFDLEEKRIIPICQKIIDDFNPDVIHIFGSEWCFGLLAEKVSIPLVIHMQGSIPSCYNARFPSGYNRINFVFDNLLNPFKIFQLFKADYFFKLRAKRERRILRKCQNFMGRTEWDKSLIKLFSPNSTYFHCDEALRPSFINSQKYWAKEKKNEFVIISVISVPQYKGADLILKTAKLLLENSSIKFRWEVYGIMSMQEAEKLTRINCNDTFVYPMGKINEYDLVERIISADLFVHPSYIDNSPNSVCEAQILGIPVIATNVGGVSSLVSHDETGILVCANDPFFLAEKTIELFLDEEKASRLGKLARSEAVNRHDPKKIVETLVSIYSVLLSKQ